MRQPLFRIATLVVGTAAAFAGATEPEILPVVDIQLESGPAPIIVEPMSTAKPRKLHLTNEAATPRVGACDQLPAPCATCLPEPAKVTIEATCGCCKKQERMWFDAEYLLWWVKNEPLNAVLFTAGPTGQPGALGNAGVLPLFGGQAIEFDPVNGGRISAGYWFNNCRTIGVESSAFLLERGGTGFSLDAGTNNVQALSRPFIDAQTGAESAAFVSFPPAQAGGGFAWASTRFWGTNTDVILNVRERSCYRIDALVGFDYLDLQETLVVGDSRTVPAIPGFAINSIDSFATRNHFYGADFGLRGVATRGRFDLAATFRLGLGVTHETSEIVGQSTATVPPNNFASPAGFLAVASNSGTISRDRFAYAPQATFKASYRITQHLNAFAAYDFLYLSNVMRPGDQVDRTINVAQLPVATGFNPTPPAQLAGPARPSAEAVPGDFFAQGISLGMGVTY